MSQKFYGPLLGPYQGLPLQDRVDLGAMVMKGYSTFPKTPALLEPHHQIFNDISRAFTNKDVLLLSRDAISVFYNPSRLATQGQSRHGSNGNEELCHIPKSYRIIGASSSDCLMSYPGHLLRGGVLPLCRDAVSVFVGIWVAILFSVVQCKKVQVVRLPVSSSSRLTNPR